MYNEVCCLRTQLPIEVKKMRGARHTGLPRYSSNLAQAAQAWLHRRAIEWRPRPPLAKEAWPRAALVLATSRTPWRAFASSRRYMGASLANRRSWEKLCTLPCQESMTPACQRSLPSCGMTLRLCRKEPWPEPTSSFAPCGVVAMCPNLPPGPRGRGAAWSSWIQSFPGR